MTTLRRHSINAKHFEENVAKERNSRRCVLFLVCFFTLQIFPCPMLTELYGLNLDRYLQLNQMNDEPKTNYIRIYIPTKLKTYVQVIICLLTHLLTHSVFYLIKLLNIQQQVCLDLFFYIMFVKQSTKFYLTP